MKTTLYNINRPKTFDDVIGQEYAVNILKKGIQEDLLPQTILFSGTRGIGKTSLARIIARAVNCLSDSSKPCNECTACIQILRNKAIDIFEMDAASNTSVENIKPIIESCVYAPQSLRYRVFIIDEVHMLSKSAFNALLKTLEEPLAHNYFIFATTEPGKIPATILSRCIKFDLRPLTTKALIVLINKIMPALDMDSVSLVAELADGSARDALSLLDKIAINNIHSPDGVRNILGLPSVSVINDLFSDILSGSRNAFEKINIMMISGLDPVSIINELFKKVHNYAIDNPHVLPNDLLVCYWQILIEGMQDVKIAPNHTHAMQMIVLKMMSVDPWLCKRGEISISHFDDIVNILHSAKAIQLEYAVKNFLQPLSIKGNVINVGIKKNAPQNFINLLEKKLSELIKNNITIVVHDDVQTLTIKEEQEKMYNDSLIEVKSEPMGKEILLHFPDAVVVLNKDTEM